jgi:hypothetical protein
MKYILTKNPLQYYYYLKKKKKKLKYIMFTHKALKSVETCKSSARSNVHMHSKFELGFRVLSIDIPHWSSSCVLSWRPASIITQIVKFINNSWRYKPIHTRYSGHMYTPLNTEYLKANRPNWLTRCYVRFHPIQIFWE